jgi:hypothetical protein
MFFRGLQAICKEVSVRHKGLFNFYRGGRASSATRRKNLTPLFVVVKKCEKNNFK